jgi:hypothetical protein
MPHRLAVLALVLLVIAAQGCRRKGRGPYFDPPPAAHVR